LLFFRGPVDTVVGGNVAGDVGVLPGPSVGRLDGMKFEEKIRGRIVMMRQTNRRKE
jgi:hypothetical protein